MIGEHWRLPQFLHSPQENSKMCIFLGTKSNAAHDKCLYQSQQRIVKWKLHQNQASTNGHGVMKEGLEAMLSWHCPG